MNQQVATWFDLVRIKDPLTREVGVITQGPPAEIHGKGVDVVQLDPVHPLTVVVGQTVLVGCQDFRNHHSLVAHARINGVAPGFRLQGIGLGSQIFSVLRAPGQLSLAFLRRSKEELIGPGTVPDHRGCGLAVEQKVAGVQALDGFGKSNVPEEQALSASTGLGKDIDDVGCVFIEQLVETGFEAACPSKGLGVLARSVIPVSCSTSGSDSRVRAVRNQSARYLRDRSSSEPEHR